jgi:hypothetical protein
MPLFETTYTVKFKITDKKLYDKFDRYYTDDDDSHIVEFLSLLLDTIRFSEYFLKRWVSVESDELYWDEETNSGEIETCITIKDNYDDDDKLWADLIEFLNETFGTTFNTDISTFTKDDIAELVCKGGPFYSIIDFATMISTEDNGMVGLFLEEYDSNAEKYHGKIHNLGEPNILKVSWDPLALELYPDGNTLDDLLNAND